MTHPAHRLAVVLATAGLTVFSMTSRAADTDLLPKLAVKDVVASAYRPFAPGEVLLLDGPFQHAEQMDATYLMSLEPDRLLSGFRSVAGLTPKAEKYGGWESRGVAGHSLGHYLSAMANLYALHHDPAVLAKINYVVDELAEVQKANGSGELIAFPEGKKIFEEVKAADIRTQGFDLNGGWVPWYTFHKQLAGLRDAYLYTGNKQALAVALANADWAIDVTSNLTPELWQKMLSAEHGGMNEVLADLYAITGEPKYKDLSLKFFHHRILDPLMARQDILPGNHGNTQIPKLIGLSRLYELTGEEKFRTAADYFWNTVIDTQSYANGGNTSNEHFGRPNTQGSRITGNTSETCNTYNMLKLAGHLYDWSRDDKASMKLADWAERATFNHILASQNPDTGMVIYYAKLGPASTKTWSTRTEDFWCCVGTGMENHLRYGQWIYAKGDGVLAVNQFIASAVTWAEQGVTVTQETRFPDEPKTALRVKADGPRRFTVRLRYPTWAQGDAKLKLNGVDVATTGKPGTFIELDRTWNDGDSVELALPMAIHDEALPDLPQRHAIFYGPILLAGQVDKDKSKNPALVTNDKPVADWLKPTPGDIELTYATTAVGKPADVKLIPFYDVKDGAYNVYWDYFTPAQWKAREAAYREEQARAKDLEARTVDGFTPGEQQPEKDHELVGERSRAGEYADRTWRDAFDGGYFEFTLKVDPAAKNELILTYYGSDAGGREFDIVVDGKVIGTKTLDNEKPEQFIDVAYPLGAELVSGKSSVRVRLQAHPGKIAGGMFGVRMVRAK